MKILYYEPTSGFGGSSRCLLSWLKRMDCTSFSPIVIVHYEGPAILDMRKLPIKIIKIPFKKINIATNFPLIPYLALLINFIIFDLPSALVISYISVKERVSIMHLNAKIISVIPGVISSIFTKIPCICHLHDTKIPIKREKFFANYINTFVVLTKKAYDLYKEQYPNKDIVLIQNGIDIGLYKPNFYGSFTRKEFNLKEDDFVVGIVGRLVEGKGFSDFIKAAKIVASKCSQVKFIIVGSGIENHNYENYLRKLTEDLGMKKKIIFSGWVKDIKDLISVFNILVQASSTFPEGFGLTVIEAMALAKPVIVTNIPGPSELVIDGATGIIIPPGDPASLANAIEIIRNNKELEMKLGENARKHVELNFDLNFTMQKIQALYHKLSIKGNND